MAADTLFTPSGVRLRRRCARPGALNWLFLPGGPGIGSESLIELADALTVPGAVWLVDLPGDGSNAPPDPETCFDDWPGVLLEATDLLANCVFAGHSTGGMYLLSVPELESRLRGLILISTAPDASWKPRFIEMTGHNPLPEVDAATRAYEAEPDDARLGALAVATAPWNFTPAGLAAGRDLLARMPYNRAAVDWSDQNFDDIYEANWFPAALPTLILAGAEDRIVSQHGWDDTRFAGPHILRRRIAGAGHFPWIEAPEAVAAAFEELATRIRPVSA